MENESFFKRGMKNLGVTLLVLAIILFMSLLYGSFLLLIPILYTIEFMLSPIYFVLALVNHRYYFGSIVNPYCRWVFNII